MRKKAHKKTECATREKTRKQTHALRERQQAHPAKSQIFTAFTSKGEDKENVTQKDTEKER